MTDCRVGDFCLAPFPFSDLSTSKKRPVLILSLIANKHLPPMAVVAMVTSQIKGEPLTGDFILKDWKDSGLLYPSKVRLGKVVSLEQDLFLQKLGSLSGRDRESIKLKLKQVWKTWF